jgi:hypothetical protein
MADPWIRIAEEFDRDDGLDEYFGETKQQMVDRWDREHPAANNTGINGITQLHRPNGKARTGADVSAPKIVPEKESLRWLDMSKWDDEPVPERKWAIRDRVPLNQTGLFSGEGGAGKSIIELMKDVAHVTGKDWLRSLPEPGPAFYVGAEDDKDELHIRLAAIAKHYDTTFKELIDGGLHVLCLLGQDATLCAANPRTGKVETTALYRQLYETAGDIKQRISRLTRCLAPSPETRLIAVKSTPLPCTCRRWRWSPRVR